MLPEAEALTVMLPEADALVPLVVILPEAVVVTPVEEVMFAYNLLVAVLVAFTGLALSHFSGILKFSKIPNGRLLHLSLETGRLAESLKHLNNYSTDYLSLMNIY